MFKYYKGEGKETWRLIENSDKAIQAAIESGAKFITVLSVDQDVDNVDDDKKVNYKGPLYFDIDNDTDEDASLLDCRRLLLKLYSYGVNLNDLIIHCSGRKGFHVLVPAKVFSSGKATAYLPLTYKQMALEFGLANLDYGIYSCGRGRMWRIENLKRDSGRHKVRLSAAQVFGLSMSDISTLTLLPGESTPFNIDKNVEFSAELAALFRRCDYKPPKLTFVPDERFRNMVNPPFCIQRLLKAEGLVEGKRFNHVILILCAYAKAKGWRLSELEQEADRALEELHSSVYRSFREKKTHLRSIYNFVMASPEYRFACSIMRKTVQCELEGCPSCDIQRLSDEADYDPSLGIEVNHNCYYRKTDSGRSQLTTFVIKPHSMVEFIDVEHSEYTITTTLIADNGHTSPVVFSQPDWANKSSLIKKLPHPDFAYIGGDTDVQRIFKVISQINIPKRTGVKVIGLHKLDGQWHFVSSEGSLSSDGSPGNLLLESDYYLPTRLIKESIPTPSEVEGIMQHLFKFNAIELTVPLVGWFVASMYKERIFEFTRQFPLLFIFGAAGAGKTQTILNLKRLFCLEIDNIKSIADVTSFTLIKSANSNNTIPLMLDEYKASMFNQFQVKMVSKLIRAAYNNEMGERGTASQNIQTYFYRSPIIMAGEQTVTEPAARDRIIEVHMNKVHSAPHLEDFKKLSTQPLNKLGKLLLLDALSINEVELQQLFNEALESIPECFVDRPRLNQAVIYTGIKLLARVLEPYKLSDLPEKAWKEYLKYKGAQTIEEQREAKKSDVDRILEVISSMPDVDSKYSVSKNYEYRLHDARGFLYLHMKVLYGRFLKFCEEYKAEAEPMNYTSFSKLVKKEPYFVSDSVPVQMSHGVKLCLALDIKKLEAKFLDLSTFLDSKPATEEATLKL